MHSVLLIDDDNLLVKFLSRLLAVNGFEVQDVNNGEDALIMLKTVIPDLIVLDGLLPGIGGYETLRRLKESEGLRDIPVVMLSAQGSEQDFADALSAGAVDYIVKPFKTGEFIVRINRAIGIAENSA